MSRRGKPYTTLIYWPSAKALSRMTAYELFCHAWRELGASLFYMDYFYGDLDFGSQRGRVEKLCRKLAASWQGRIRDNPANRAFWRRFLSDIAEEIENQC